MRRTSPDHLTPRPVRSRRGWSYPAGALLVATLLGCRSAEKAAEAARRDATTPRGARLVSIPGATFAFREPLSSGTATVTVSAFQIEATEVTVAAYRACVEAKACVEPAGEGRVRVGDAETCNWGVAGRDDHPINCVSPAEAEAYCQWNGGRRLPTIHEAYWAALGDARMSEGDRLSTDAHRRYPWGRAEPERVDHCWKRGSFGAPRGGVVGPITASPAPVARDLGTCPVASHPGDRSPFGLYDTAGNVAEIVYDPRPKTCISRAGEHPCPREEMYQVTGGSWSDNESIGDPSPADFHGLATPRHPWYGFRCVAGPPPP